MNLAAIREEVGKQPFEPLTLRLSDGSQVAVRHPDFFAVSPPRTIFVGKGGGGYEIIDPLHVVAIERPDHARERARSKRRGER